MRTLAFLWLILVAFVTPHDASAQTAFSHDPAGNLAAASNLVTAVPAFATTPRFLSAQSNGLLSVCAPVTGTGPFSYQWLLNGSPVAGATNDCYFLPNATSAQLGNYQLVAANAAGSATSAVINVSFDTDHNGLPDAWEFACFGHLGNSPTADPDGDGISNAGEAIDGTAPNDARSFKPTWSSSPPTLAPSGLVAWWPGNGNALDMVGTNHGSLLSGATATGIGIEGACFVLTSGARIDCGRNAVLDFTNAFSIEAWLYSEDTNGWKMIFTKWDDISEQRAYHFAASNGLVGLKVLLAETNVAMEVNDALPLALREWTHYVGTVDADEGKLRLFRNGLLVNTAAYASKYLPSRPAVRVYMGGKVDGTCGFEGRLNEVCVYNHALKSSEVASLYLAKSAAKVAPPSFRSQPQSLVVLAGTPATLSVDAGGFPVYYQWLKDGVLLPGAVNPTLVLATSSMSNSGSYSVLISNLLGTLTSSPALLTIASSLTDLEPPIVNPDRLFATQSVARTFSIAHDMLGNDWNSHGFPLSLIGASGLPPVAFSADFQAGLPLEASSYGTKPYSGILATNGTNVYLQLTAGRTNQVGSFVIANLTSNLPVSAFVATFKMRISDTSSDPADGFSFNFANDLPFAASGPGNNESGVGTGLSVCYKAYHYEGVQGRSGMFVKLGGQILASCSVPTWSSSNFIPVQVVLTTSGKVTVSVNGTNVINEASTPFLPIVNGRFGFYARTGGAYESHSVDDVKIILTIGDTPPETSNTGFQSGMQESYVAYGTTSDAGILATNGTSVFLQLTAGRTNQAGSFVVANLAINLPLSAFVATFKMRISDTSSDPADGFSFNFANDLPFAARDLGDNENGVGTGLSVCYKAYHYEGVQGRSGMFLKFGGQILASNSVPTWNSSSFVQVQVILAAGGKVTVCVDGTNVFSAVDTPFLPVANGRFGFFARTGGQYESHSIDDVNISWLPITGAGGGRSISVAGDVISYSPPKDCGLDALYYIVSDGLYNGYGIGTATVVVATGRLLGINSPASVLLETDGGGCTASAVVLGTPAISGACATVVVTNDAPTQFPSGTNLVVWTVVDAQDNTATATQLVVVVDATPPSVTCPGNMIASSDTGQNFRSNVTYLATASDNCTVTKVTCEPPSGSMFSLGTTTVTCTATDSSGNTAQCSFAVTIRDAESPRLSCPANLLLSANTSLCSRSNVAYHVTATDNCAVTNVACAPPDGSTFTVGEHRVLCIATDAAGNSAQCAFTVTVTDDESPQISCPSDLFLGRDAGQSARSNVIYAATATDNCTVTNLSCVPPSGSTFPVGSNRVDCTASDSSGHRAACAFNVVVADFLISAANEQVNARVPDGSPLGLVSSLEVSSPIERVTDVSLVLQISGGFNGDLFAYLVHGSNHAILLNRPGKTLVNPLGYADAGLTVTLNDAAAHGDIHAYRQTLFGNSTPPLAGPLPGLWAPDGRDADPALVLDTEPRTATLSAFSGFNPNGRWTLFIADMDAGYTSTLVSWGLEIHGTNAPPVQALPPLSISWPEGLGLSLEGRGTAGQSCILQTSSNLFDWLDYTNLFANTNGWFRFQEPLLTNLPSLFYRLRGP